MTAKGISPIDRIKLWAWGGMATFCVFFCVQFYNQVGEISKNVDSIKINVATHDQKLNDLSEKVIGIDQNVTKILFHWQKETAAKYDNVYNRFGTDPAIGHSFVNKFVDP